MNDLNEKEILIERLSELDLDQDYKEFKKKATSLYRDFINHLTEDEIQSFSGYFAKSLYCLQKYEYPEKIQNHFGVFNYLLKNPNTKEKRQFISNYLDNLINFYFSPNNFSVVADIDFEYKAPEIRHSLKCIVISKYASGNLIKCLNEELGEFDLELKKDLSIYSKILLKGFSAYLINMDFVHGEKITLKANENSMIVFEPDLLFDVTNIAECFQQTSYNVNIYFLKLFDKSIVNEALFKGNLINYFFDKLIFNPEIELDQVFDEALKIKPLGALALQESGYNLDHLRNVAKNHFENLQENIEFIESDKISIEPSFISPIYGLQGRLDALLEFEDPLRKDVIELKSGKPAPKNLTISDSNDQRIPVGVWSNHLSQTSCYNLLLDSTFENRKGFSQILYSKDENYPFRNVPNINRFKWESVECRNRILSYEIAISKGKYSVFEDINPQNFGNRPSYLNDKVIEFSDFYKSLDQISEKYFQYFVTFLIRESFAQRSGLYANNPENSYSSSWNEILDNDQFLDDLTIDFENSDLDKSYFRFIVNSSQLSSFRKGDIVILIPEKEGLNMITQNQILKSVVKEINDEYILISLRNKLTNFEILENVDSWKIVKDYSDANLKRLYPYLYQLLKSDKKELILGLKESTYSEKNIPENDLDKTQNIIFKKAICSDDYFLLQGPPGTGKTSYFLRNLVKYYLEQTDQDIFLTAYTNRAVDQICNSLDSAGFSEQYVRIGSSESTENDSRLISRLSRELNFDELTNEIKKSRIIVSTLSSAISNSEIFEIKKFHACIVDEAAQILEIQIAGFLSQFQKFILIGDEKQLPAITAQKEESLIVNDPDLKSISFSKLSSSLFERLLLNCRRNSWDKSYGMLTKQARMVDSIMNLSNHLFYDNKLESLYENNEDSELTFINSSIEKSSKSNSHQAEITKSLVQELLNDYSIDEIGVIAPFKKQCNLIKKELRSINADGITVDTVERFQGSERDVIIISTCVNHSVQLKQIESKAQLEGIEIDRKLNVAITRAKRKLFILGNKNVLSKSENYRKMIDFIEDNNKFLNFENS